MAIPCFVQTCSRLDPAISVDHVHVDFAGDEVVLLGAAGAWCVIAARAPEVCEPNMTPGDNDELVAVVHHALISSFGVAWIRHDSLPHGRVFQDRLSQDPLLLVAVVREEVRLDLNAV